MHMNTRRALITSVACRGLQTGWAVLRPHSAREKPSLQLLEVQNHHGQRYFQSPIDTWLFKFSSLRYLTPWGSF